MLHDKFISLTAYQQQLVKDYKEAVVLCKEASKVCAVNFTYLLNETNRLSIALFKEGIRLEEI